MHASHELGRQPAINEGQLQSQSLLSSGRSVVSDSKSDRAVRHISLPGGTLLCILGQVRVGRECLVMCESSVVFSQRYLRRESELTLGR